MLTQKDIALAANLSRMTVYRYLLRKKVSPTSRRRIEQVLQGTGYRKNLTARSLVLQKTNLIGLLVPSVSYSFYPDIIQAIQQTARKSGYNVLLAVSNEDPEQEKEEIDILLSIPVDGLIAIPTSAPASEDNFRMMLQENTLFVMVDRYLENVKASYVVTDSYSSSQRLVQYLIGLGHKRIAHIGGPLSNSFARGVRRGYYAALSTNRIPVDEEIIFTGSMDGNDVPAIMDEIVARKPIPTAIQAVNDVSAIQILREAKSRGIRIPKDMSLVGFSDIEMAGLLEVPLTTAREDARLMGMEAAGILFDLMNGKRKRRISRLLDAEIVVRKSAAPVRRKGKR